MPAIRLTLRCNNRCVMCGQAGLTEEISTAGISGETPDGSTVCFTGGEPLLVEDLEVTIAAARSAGARHVGIQTNTRGLATRLPALAEAGLTFVHVSIHGATAAVHDYHTGVPGTFTEIRSGLDACRRAGITAVATTVVTRSNFRVLAAIPALLRNHRIAAWMLSVPHATGRAARGFDRVYPRIGLALPYALHALRAAEGLELPARITGAPLCSLGPFAARSHPSPERSYARACQDCDARSRCPGLDPLYLARFAADELRPRAAVPAPADDPIWEMFAGPGALAPMDPSTEVHEAPAQARRHLPVLGKSRPAVAETRRGDAKKTGSALGEIFPELFDDVED
jgi:hypothetical protein